MNKSQKLVLTIGAVAAILMGLFPPWSYIFAIQSVSQSAPAGYSFIFSPPHSEMGKLFGGVELDSNRLAIQWVLVVIATSVSLVLLHKKGISEPTNQDSIQLNCDAPDANQTPLQVRNDPKRESNSNVMTHPEISNIYERSMGSRLRFLISRATDAVFNLMLQRSAALPNYELMALVKVVKNCGKISDESGNLLPLLFYDVSRHTLEENSKPGQYQSIIAVIDYPAVDSCIHGRSVRPDALERMVSLIRANFCESPELTRQLLTAQVDPKVNRHLIILCGELRSLVRAKQQASTEPPPGSLWWNYYFYDSIAVFEALGHGNKKQG